MYLHVDKLHMLNYSNSHTYVTTLVVMNQKIWTIGRDYVNTRESSFKLETSYNRDLSVPL